MWEGGELFVAFFSDCTVKMQVGNASTQRFSDEVMLVLCGSLTRECFPGEIAEV